MGRNGNGTLSWNLWRRWDICSSLCDTVRWNWMCSMKRGTRWVFIVDVYLCRLLHRIIIAGLRNTWEALHINVDVSFIVWCMMVITQRVERNDTLGGMGSILRGSGLFKKEDRQRYRLVHSICRPQRCFATTRFDFFGGICSFFIMTNQWCSWFLTFSNHAGTTGKIQDFQVLIDRYCTKEKGYVFVCSQTFRRSQKTS